MRLKPFHAILLNVLGQTARTLCTRLFACPNPKKNVYILDDQSRICIYHGINVSNYAKNDLSFMPWQTKEEFAILKKLGLNMVRLMVFWEALEPEKGTYDSKYIDNVLQRIGWLQELGIDVLVDFHQDIYCRKFTGDGFPLWTVNDDGHPFTPKEPWDLNLVEPAVLASYDNFWRSEDLKTAYIAAIDKLATYLSPYENVIGIDVMNEPFPWKSSRFEQNPLTNLYKKIRPRLAKTNHNLRVFFEPVIYTSAGIGSFLKYDGDYREVYAPHFYDPFCDKGSGYGWFNKLLLKFAVRMKVREAQKFHAPLIYGEFGMDPDRVKNWQAALTGYLELSDKYHFGWIYYAYDMKQNSGFGIMDNEKNLLPNSKVLSRIYPQKIAGRNPTYSFDGKVFILTYDTPMNTVPTLIWTPTDKKLKIETNGTYTIDADGTMSYISTSSLIQSIKIEIVSP